MYSLKHLKAEIFSKTHETHILSPIVKTTPFLCRGEELGPVVATLQAALERPGDRVSGAEQKEDRLTGLPAPARLLLRLLLPLAHSCVADREASKSLLIRTVSQFRCGYRLLGQKLVAAGRLPAPDLVWFLTHAELGRLAAGRQPGLARRATRRRNLFPQWDTAQFPEVVRGRPGRMATLTAPDVWTGGASVRGTPACPGRVTGPARVITRLEDAVRIFVC